MQRYCLSRAETAWLSLSELAVTLCTLARPRAARALHAVRNARVWRESGARVSCPGCVEFPGRNSPTVISVISLPPPPRGSSLKSRAQSLFKASLGLSFTDTAPPNNQRSRVNEERMTTKRESKERTTRSRMRGSPLESEGLNRLTGGGLSTRSRKGSLS